MSFPFLNMGAIAGAKLASGGADGGSSGAVGGWIELGRHTLSSAGTSIDVNCLPDKEYLMVIQNHYACGSQPDGRFNNDSGSNYSYRWQNDGSDGTGTSKPNMKTSNGWNTTCFGVWFAHNNPGEEKMSQFFTVTCRGTGAGTAVSRSVVGNKWANTSSAVSSINWGNGGPGGSQFKAGTEFIVLGWDPDDSHTCNFWEEVADTTFTSSGVSAQTFTAKKYLWIQFWFTSDSSANGQYFQLGDTGGIDTGSTYNRRFSINGGSDSTSTNQSKIYFAPQTGAVTHFVNMFVLNESSREKLVIIHATTNNGNGSGNAPQRRETVGKWVETTNQCDRITIATDAGTFTGGQLKVWGAD